MSYERIKLERTWKALVLRDRDGHAFFPAQEGDEEWKAEALRKDTEECRTCHGTDKDVLTLLDDGMFVTAESLARNLHGTWGYTKMKVEGKYPFLIWRVMAQTRVLRREMKGGQ